MRADAPLILCTQTLSPELYRVSVDDQRAFVEATAAAGFDGLALSLLHVYLAMHADVGLDEIAGWYADAGLVTPLCEAATTWAGGEDDATIRAATAPVLELATRFGCEVLVVTHLGSKAAPIADAGRGLATVCALAADAGMRVALEFLPWTAIADLRTAVALLDATGADNAGILLDCFHWQRQPGGPDLELLASLPSEAVAVLQLCDVAESAGDDLETEAMTARALPGSGVVDLDGLLRTLADMGAEPLVAPEVFNAELARQGPTLMANRVYATSRAVLYAALGTG